MLFVEGADTVPAKLPINLVWGEELASRICECLRETEYAMFDFSFEPLAPANRHKMPAWAVMATDAKEGVYGTIAAGICRVTERLYLFMGGHRSSKLPQSTPSAEEIKQDADGEKDSPPKGKRGRPSDYDPKMDKRIHDAWKTGKHRTQQDCDRALGLSLGSTHDACERHRGRLKRKNKRRTK